MWGVLIIASLTLITGLVLYSGSHYRSIKIRASDQSVIQQPGTVPDTFIYKIAIMGFLIRFAVVLLFNATDAIRVLHLSPDSLWYHKNGIIIAGQMSEGFFNWPNWIDNGWFQFTGFVYYLFGNHSFIIQLINITLSSITPVVIYYMLALIYDDIRVARWTALFTAFFPSFIYWSCLMLKDSISILSMSVLALSVVSMRKSFHPGWLLPLALSLTVFMGIRTYMFFVALFFVVVSFIPVEKKGAGKLLIKAGVMVLVIGCGSYIAGFGFMGMDYISNSHYFDIDYINSTRVAMGDHGSGAFFKDPSTAVWGKDVYSTLRAASTAVLYYFVSIDITRISSHRQLMALPEVLVFIMLLPVLVSGMLHSWKKNRHLAFPLFVFSIGIMAVYGSATTNMGAMFRWRMQSLPFFLAFVSYGLVMKQEGAFYHILNKLRL